VVSAHKNGEAIPSLAGRYNGSIDPGVVVAVAGLSNGLGGALAANLDLPVLSAPPFKDQVDMLVNVGSSLMYPSGVAAGTVIGAEAAAALALRALNLPALRRGFVEEIARTKASLAEADLRLRRA
jgi:phosphoribosylcarboxyaminoimidazole (NCAIR) mutase